MFFDSLTTMLHKQNLSDYLVSKLSILKLNPSFKLDSFIVQVISNDVVTDSITNFHTKFTPQQSHQSLDPNNPMQNVEKTANTDKSINRAIKKGSFIRLIQWKLDFKTFDLIIQSWQYLGGAGYGVKSGRPWDIQKLKIITSSEIVSKDFIVLYNPISNNHMLSNNPAQGKIFKLPASKQRVYTLKFQKKPKQKYPQPTIQPQKPIQNTCQKMQQESPSEHPHNLQPNNNHSPNIHKPLPTAPSFNPQPLSPFQKLQKLKLPSDPSTQHQLIENLSLSVRSLLRNKKQYDEAKLEIGQQQQQQSSRQQKNGGTLVNEDSLGRHLVFNKDEIKKLLGKEE